MNIDKFLGCILAVAVGDALSVPFEKMSAEDIRSKVDGDIDRYFPISVNPDPLPSAIKSLPGEWSDDTQLTVATIEAITEAGGLLDMDHIVQKHIDAFYVRKGWGRSTTRACKRLIEGVSWKDSGEPEGAGNGIMMKIVPLGLMQSLTRKEESYFMRECIDFGKMTHGATPAIVAGYVHASAANYLSRRVNVPLNVADFLTRLRNKALKAESILPTNINKISDQISFIAKLYREGKLENSPKELSGHFGGDKNFSAFESFGISYAIFIRSPYEFKCLSDVIMAGGDTDSNASIVGSLMGAYHGTSIVPYHLLIDLSNRQRLLALTGDFFITIERVGGQLCEW